MQEWLRPACLSSFCRHQVPRPPPCRLLRSQDPQATLGDKHIVRGRTWTRHDSSRSLALSIGPRPFLALAVARLRISILPGRLLHESELLSASDPPTTSWMEESLEKIP